MIRKSQNRHRSASEVIDAVCALANAPMHEILGSGRILQVVRAREVMVGCLREMSGPITPSFPEIAALMGKRNHSSVWTMYARWQGRTGRDRAKWVGLVIDRIARDRLQSGDATP